MSLTGHGNCRQPSRNTRAQLKQVFDALRELMTPPEPPRLPIGFVHPQEKKDKPASGKAAGKTTSKARRQV